MNFTHLHVHTEYSLLDGASRIDDLVAKAKELGMTALAITDHGAMFGTVKFFKACQSHGIKPIIGCEIYVAPRTMEDKDPNYDKHSNHLVLLAENEQGYKNLIKLVSMGYTKGYYYKPRVDMDALRKHSKGLIALSACLAGAVPSRLLRHDYEGAKEKAVELQEIFGKGNFFLELQDQGLEEEQEVNQKLVELARTLDIPLVATNDVHYVRREDAKNHDVLLAIQMATTVDDPGRMRFPNDQFYLKSPKEMATIFAYAPDAIENTMKIAERCNFQFEFGNYHLPEFKAPEGMTNWEYFRKLCYEGIESRFSEVTDEIRKRLDYEMDVIKSMGYVEYFLIVWDFINFAKKNSIAVGPGRGSAVGSLVSYALKITDVNPIQYGLIFERFLNPKRVSMPDIDIDFCIERRGEVIDYVIEKYGEANVSQIITFGTMKARAAIRDVARALAMDYKQADKIAKAVPMDLKMTIKKALEVSPDLKAMYEGDDKVKAVVDTSMALEGMPRHASTHAAGVVISKLPLDEYLPLYMAGGVVSTQFTKTTVEELGLLKMDFLGLRNLTVIRNALMLIKENHGVDIDFSTMSYEDEGVYQLISQGNTGGVFQLESPGMTQFMKNLKPTCFEDVVAGVSLYRPGPMDSIPKYIENKRHPEKIKYLTAELEPILNMTYGCLVYQEQVMQIVRDLAGYDYGRSDLVRRTMSGKDHKKMMAEKEIFLDGKVEEDGSISVPGCIRNGISREVAEEIFADMASFAEYAFNKSHAAAYAVVAFQTGYLKRYYPVEFMAALMTSVMGDAKAMAKYIKNAQEMGIEILPPCVNKSHKVFSTEDGKIRFGLLGIKNLGEGAIDEIIKAREEKGLPSSLSSFINNLDISKVNRKAVESLIKSGATKALGSNCASQIASFESLMSSAQDQAKRNVAGQISLFSADDVTWDDQSMMIELEEFDSKQLLALEKETLGVYISDHPLRQYKDSIEKYGSVTCKELTEEGERVIDLQGRPLKDGSSVTLGGMISSCKSFVTKSGKVMAFAEISDFYGSVEVVVFPNVFEQYRENIEEDSCVFISGTLDFKDEGQPKLIANAVVAIDEYSIDNEQPKVAGVENKVERQNEHEANLLKASEGKVTGTSGYLKIKLRPHEDGNQLNKWLCDIENLVSNHSGSYKLLIYTVDGKTLSMSKWGVHPSESLVAALGSLPSVEKVKVD